MRTDVMTLPERAGSRGEAQHLLERVPRSLAGTELRFDGHQLGAGSSSFMDELVKEVLVERGASSLILDGITPRAAEFARAAAARRGVAGRLISHTR
jgi:hypothetical protein